MSTLKRLEEIEARVNAATEGPWGVTGRDGDLVRTKINERLYGYGIQASPKDAAFIAHARTDVPYLLQLVRSYAAEVERLRKSVNLTATCDAGEGHKCPWCVRHAKEASVLADAIAKEREGL